jgi:hypothetical protein
VNKVATVVVWREGRGFCRRAATILLPRTGSSDTATPSDPLRLGKVELSPKTIFFRLLQKKELGGSLLPLSDFW